MPIRVIFFFCALTAACLAEADKYTIAPPPAWVKPIEAPTGEAPSSQDVGSGVYWRLVDYQIDEASKHMFYRTVKQYLSPDGVQADSDLRVNFDPAYEQLILHTVTLTRDGKSRELLKPSIVRLLNREQDADNFLYDGSLDALIILEDIRPGDIVEFSYSVIGANPIFEGRAYHSFYMNWSTPVGRRYTRVIYPASCKLAWQDSSEKPLPEPLEPTPETREMVWDDRDVPAVKHERECPRWYNPYRRVRCSEYASWADVVAWGIGIYGPPQELTPPMKKLTDGWMAEFDTPAKRAIAALRFVQDEIRYLGLEMGEGSHRPNPPELVFSRRFGDCKDKVNLLRALLHGMGIESAPVLVNTDDGPSLPKRLPTPLLFDHVVSVITIDGKRTFVDPTMSHQRGNLATNYFPDYGHGLILAPGITELTKLKPGPDTQSRLHVTHTFFIPDDVKGVATLKVETRNYGDHADDVRWEISDAKLDDLGHDYLNFYAADYPSIQIVGKPAFHDDPEQNVLSSEENYRIPGIWQKETGDTDYSCDLRPADLINYLSMPDEIIRTAPLRISYPLHVIQDIVVTFETPGDYAFDNDSMRIETDAFAFNYQARFNGTRLKLHFEYEARRDFVPAAEVAEHVRRLNEVYDELGFTIVTDPESPGDGKLDDTQAVLLALALIAGTALASCAGTVAIMRARGWRRY